MYNTVIKKLTVSLVREYHYLTWVPFFLSDQIENYHVDEEKIFLNILKVFSLMLSHDLCLLKHLLINEEIPEEIEGSSQFLL